ncbi:hypothetical protein AVEN_30449-1 [Araneus ventricosus]|uniref:Reverse transcriptase RNase H-like domain-containing protein n=1 Tax=Araneus ventricosus TaxID=182803 RepID=A0A4Y2WPT1_ARAVE|nr:hypothetical protein AVEN_30449-1 [Araneus ventricosus]
MLKYYLDGQNFTIETDPNPLVWFKTNAGANPLLMRWSLALQPFQYKVIHKAGKKHLNADALSRNEIGLKEEEKAPLLLYHEEMTTELSPRSNARGTLMGYKTARPYANLKGFREFGSF